MKLYHLTGDEFSIYDYRDSNGAAVTRVVGQIPMVFWPNGRWCFEANAYVGSLIAKGVSRRNRGGTLHTYVSQISHLLRFCAGFGGSGTKLIDLTDNQFTAFIRTLEPVGGARGPLSKNRSLTHVREIGIRCLHFLQFVGSLYGNAQFVNFDGQIRIQESRTTRRWGSRSRRATSSGITHNSLPVGDELKRRVPIPPKDVERLRSAVPELGGSPFIQRRRLILLTLLEVTIGRRFEIAKIRVDDVLAAAEMKHPAIRMITAKKRGAKHSERLVPISSAVLVELLDFIRTSRKLAAYAATNSLAVDGYLLLSASTGDALTPATITTEISLLRRKAGIEGKACAHMFRHAGVTRLLVQIIQRHELRSIDDFRRALLDIQGMLTEIIEITGHASPASLEDYVHIALAEVYGHESKIDEVHRDRRISDALQQYRAWRSRRGNSPRTAADAKHLEELLLALERDS